MITLEFEIEIAASRKRIWEALWSDANYRYWTQVFGEGSYVETDGWKQGTEVRFLPPDGRGMYSLIERHEPQQQLCFRHLGSIADGQREPFPEGTPSRECYTLSESDKSIRLSARLETVAASEPFFRDTFPAALARVKEKAEIPA